MSPPFFTETFSLKRDLQKQFFFHFVFRENLIQSPTDLRWNKSCRNGANYDRLHVESGARRQLESQLNYRCSRFLSPPPPDLCSAPTETSEIKTDMSTSQLQDRPAVISSSTSTDISHAQRTDRRTYKSKALRK